MDFTKQKFTLTGGEVFLRYMRKCLELQVNSPTVSIIKYAPLVLNIQIVIIDASYLIWPILTLEPKKGTIRRHGAIIFNDPLEQFVPLMKDIVARIEHMAYPLEGKHIGLEDIEAL